MHTGMECEAVRCFYRSPGDERFGVHRNELDGVHEAA